MDFRLISALAAAALLSTGGAASAQTATATTTVNVRSGPGGQYSVIDQLPAGEVVNIINCRGDWCEIGMGGDSGFVARSYLDDGARRSRVRVMEYDDYGSDQGVIEQDDPEATAGLIVGGYYESRPYYIRDGYYYWGGRWYARRPGVSGWRGASWRRWEERRGPGTIRDGRTNRPPRADDRRARIDRGEPVRDPRLRPMERGNPGGPDRDGGSRANVDRGGRDFNEPGVSEPRRGGGDGGPRAERPDGRTGGGAFEGRGGQGGAGQGGMGRTPGGSADRGDRVGLDRAGGGGRNDGGRNDR